MATRAIAFLVLLLISPAAFAQVTHNVGDTNGWNTGVNYDTWSQSQNFTVGDTLVFTYDFSHSVDEVTQANYQSCGTRNPISSASGSPATFTLSAPGTRYFICPRSNHCGQGMKVSVTVGAASGSNPPSTPTTPSTPGTSPSTPPSTPGRSPSPPGASTPAGNGAAAGILGGCRSGLVIGLTVGLVALLGMRG